MLVALLPEVRFCHPVLLKMELFLFATESTGERTCHCHLKILAKFPTKGEEREKRGEERKCV